MPRRLRFAPPGLPQHVTHRGNFAQRIFFSNADRDHYLDLLARHAVERRVRIEGFCLMPNHAHLIATPEEDGALSRFLERVSGEYAQYLNWRLRRKGHVWEARFYACSLDEAHWTCALRYVDLNPVRSGSVRDAVTYPWSSAAAHAGRRPAPGWLDLGEFRARYSAEEWSAQLRDVQPRAEVAAIRMATRLERPLASEEFVAGLEALYGVELRPKPPGPKPQQKGVRHAPGADSALSVG
jgi:putative transposase